MKAVTISCTRNVLIAATLFLASLLTASRLPAEDLSLIGQIKSRSAGEIASSNWSIGGETLDRDYAEYAKYKKYLGPLGAKHIRLQAGWAKCEKKPGVYDWAWLDEIVDDALAQKVQPWLETSYGNTIYPDGGGTGLAGGFPKSPEALAAWDNWVRALVHRYKDRVNEWEIWNEPDLSKTNTPDAYTSLFIRTTEIIRTEQPAAKIYAMGLAGNLTFAEKFLEQIKQQNKLALIDAITIHTYPKNPDDIASIEKMRTIAEKYSPAIQVRQGETGAPSTSKTFGALKGLAWTELTQAKWDLRRMLAHHAIDVPFNLFTLMELHYTTGLNSKGLLKANDNNTVARPKPAYQAAQNVFAIFDDTLERIGDLKYTAPTANRLAVHGWRKKECGAPVVAVWFSGQTPADSNATTPVDFTFPGLSFKEPVYVDLLTGKVYAIPASLKQIPIYDSPILIAEKSALPLDMKETK